MQERSIEQFKQFAKAVARTPINESSYRNKYGYSSLRSIGKDFSEAEIKQTLQNNDPNELRLLSLYFSKNSGIYSRIIQYYASLLTYGYILSPHYDISKPPKKTKLMAAYRKYAQYIKNLNLPNLLSNINMEILQSGVFYGFLAETDDEIPMIYQLPAKYCRTRFYDEYGMPIVELNLNYFDSIGANEIEKKQILALFPKQIQTRYHNIKLKANIWGEIPASDGGICFRFNKDNIPPFVAAADTIGQLDNARDREEKRDTNELYKLLIQKLPCDKNTGELLFSLPEAEVLHESLANMLTDNDTIDVLTTYADIHLENVQDSEAAAAAASARMDKYTKSVYDEFGTSQAIFNASNGSTAIIYSIKKDISLMFNFSKQYEKWINIYLKNKAKKDNLYFSILFLPTSTIFQKEDVDTYLKAAQYGYPKIAVASALGIDALDLIGISDFENNVLNLGDYLQPLSSSYTQSSGDKNLNSAKNSNQKTSENNINTEGGRPPKSITERSDKTQSNIESMT